MRRHPFHPFHLLVHTINAHTQCCILKTKTLCLPLEFKLQETVIMSQTESIQKAGLSDHRGEEDVNKGDHVAWKWGGGMAEGHVQEVSTDKMTRETKKGVEVTRNGDKSNPALYIERDGNNVVKKQSEVYKVHDED